MDRESTRVLFESWRGLMRTFKFQDKEYGLSDITRAVDREAKKYQAIEYNQLLMSSIPTEAKLMDTLKKQGIWAAEDEKELNELHSQLAELQIKLGELMDDKDNKKEEILDITSKMINLRSEVLEKLKQRFEPLNMTCESMSREVYYNVCLSLVLKENGAPIFKDYNDFLARQDSLGELVDCARDELLSIGQETGIKDLPEIKARIELGISDEDGELNVEEVIKIYSEKMGEDGEKNQDRDDSRKSAKKNKPRSRNSKSTTRRAKKSPAKSST